MKPTFLRDWSVASALWSGTCLSWGARVAALLLSSLARYKNLGLVLVASWVLSGCAGSIAHLPVYRGVPEIPCCEPDYYRQVQIKYLGAGGYLIRRGNDVLLTAPLFSNPSLFRVGLWYIRSNPDEIEQYLPPVQDAAAIIVGHAHYDHLLDVPYIAQYRAPAARIYGNDTMKNILRAYPDLVKRVVPLDAQAAIFDKPGTWQYIEERQLRFMAIQSEHAPHFWGIKFFSGEVLTPQTTVPRRASGWKEGQTFTYLIDFLAPDNTTVLFRIYYQDAASTPPLGFPPVLEPQDQRRIDVAILCVPSFDQVRNYPEGILLYTKPRAVILGHWEDFFRPWTEDIEQLKVVPLTAPQIFIARMNKIISPATPWYLPRPGAWMQFAVGQP